VSETISFTVLGRPEPQGSSKAFVVGGKARIMSANPKMKGYRQEVGWAALRALQGRETPLYGKHVPVMITIRFYFIKPSSAKKSRTCPVVPPDLDKLCRATFDALKGVAWVDDAQVVQVFATKHYGEPKTLICIAQW
jgi:Holliday junction resolvase RusA-like endonuclease